MPIYQRGAVWYIDVTTAGGARIRCSARTSDKEAAQQLHDKLKHDSWRTEQLGERPSKTWDEAALRWCREMSHKASLVNDAQHIQFFTKYFRGKPLAALTRDVIHSVVDSKLSHLKPGTINRYVATMRAILRKAEREWEWLDRAPALRMRREPKRRIRWLKPEEAQRLLSELPEHQREPATFALATGLRQSNVVNLEWSQVDMQRKVAWIHGDQAKAGNAIGVPLNESAAGVLRRQIGKHPTRVFTYKGRPLKSVNETSWGSALKRAGIEDFRWHDLRHTWASWLVQAGVPLSAVQELGAWETASMVRRYAHLAPEHLAPHAATIDAILNVTSTAQLRLVSNGL